LTPSIPKPVRLVARSAARQCGETRRRMRELS
jgi:hypothetical protein